MKIKDIENFSDILIYIGATIRLFFFYPLRIIALLVGFPNVKIIYKSGHIGYHFFRKLDIKWSGALISSLEWDTVNVNRPFHIGINEIESIWRIY
jgi:hypothetical protein